MPKVKGRRHIEEKPKTITIIGMDNQQPQLIEKTTPSKRPYNPINLTKFWPPYSQNDTQKER